MALQRLLLVVDVDEGKLPPGNAYTELPDQLVGVIQGASPREALELAAVYLLNPAFNIEDEIGSLALNYHHYAVSVRGETCEEDDCEQHPMKNVLSFHDHKNRNSPPPGVN
jgi:hypothetical protein